MDVDRCPHCGAGLPPLVRDAFCRECNEALDAEPEQAPPSGAVHQTPHTRQTGSAFSTFLTIARILSWFS